MHDDPGALDLEARVLVEERAARAHADIEALDTRARAAYARTPPPESAWAMLLRGCTAGELLACGHTFHELRVSGVRVGQMLRYVTLDDLLRLGATYEGLVASDLQRAIVQGLVELNRLPELFNVSLSTLLRDRVIASPIVLARLRPSAAQLRTLGVTAEHLFESGLRTSDQMLEFQFTLEEWIRELTLQPRHLHELGENVHALAVKLGWDVQQTFEFSRASVRATASSASASARWR